PFFLSSFLPFFSFLFFLSSFLLSFLLFAFHSSLIFNFFLNHFNFRLLLGPFVPPLKSRNTKRHRQKEFGNASRYVIFHFVFLCFYYHPVLNFFNSMLHRMSNWWRPK